MQTVTLNGQWTVKEQGVARSYPATVPGTIHTDLIKAGVIPDPFYRENERDCLWVAEKNWVYSRTFTVSNTLLAHKHVVLRCEGIDTLAIIRINNKPVATTNNQFRTWEFDVREMLLEGANTIEITFDSVWPYIRSREQQRHLRTPKCIAHEEFGRPWVRKSQCNFGWDWGPVLVTCGIWRSIALVASSAPRINGLRFEQAHTTGLVDITIIAELNAAALPGQTVSARISHNEKQVAQAETSIHGATSSLRLSITNPELWWPNTMGAQPLYTITVELLDADGNICDTATRRIGLRTLRLSRKTDQWGESFEFEINGMPFFSKGANWIPADQFIPRIPAKQYRHLLESAASVNMNMIRVWGGGIYEQNLFYDLCDELGLCVWQDFMFACSAYPADEPAFLENVKAEAIDNVRRIGHHACMALWCGNNEMEQGAAGPADWPVMNWKYYKPLFDELLPQVVKQCSSGTDYWPSSAHSPRGKREEPDHPDWGDAHLWAVWHGREPFEWYRGAFHRFCSEFGFQSFPQPSSVARYTVPGDRNVTSPVMEFHQRGNHGNPNIMHYMLDWFRMPNGTDNTIWLSQIQQGLSVKYAVEHWRRNMERCRGAIYWQINDCWPVASWSSIDYYGKWKALQYMAKKFFAPVIVSGVEDPKKATVEVHVSCDAKFSCKGSVKWTLVGAEGTILRHGSLKAVVGANTSVNLETLDFTRIAARMPLRNAMLWLELYEGKNLVSENFVTFKTYKHIDLEKPRLKKELTRGPDNMWNLTIESDRPALCVFVQSSLASVTPIDNFVHIRPGRPVSIALRVTGGVTKVQLAKSLTIKSLVDTYLTI